MTISIELFLFVLLLEILVLLSMLISLFIERILTFTFKLIRRYKTKKLSLFLLSELENPLARARALPKGLRSFSLLVNTLSQFDVTFCYPLWQKIKEGIVVHYTRKKGRRYARSLFWTKRFLSGRNFSLFSTHEDLNLIRALAEDKNFLVKSQALRLLVEKNDKKGIKEVLKMIAKVNGYQHVYLKDILLSFPLQTQEIAKKLIKESSDKDLLLGALEIAASIPVKLCEKAIQLHLKNPHLKMRALAALANNPFEEAENTFISFSKSILSLERCYAVAGLAHFPTKKNIAIVEDLLSDKSYKVCLAAAKALLQIGDKGIAVLDKVASRGSNQAKDIAKIALAVPKELL